MRKYELDRSDHKYMTVTESGLNGHRQLHHIPICTSTSKSMCGIPYDYTYVVPKDEKKHNIIYMSNAWNPRVTQTLINQEIRHYTHRIILPSAALEPKHDTL